MKPEDKIVKIHPYTDYALPAYRYVPAFGVHPNKRKGIKHIPDIPKSDISFSSQNWHSSPHYLYAIDLFNNKYYWEVHEVLEKLWMESGKDSDEGVFLKALIQIAIALLKQIEGNTNGFKRLTEKAMPIILSQSNIYLGIDINVFTEKYRLFMDGDIHLQPLICLKFP